MPITLILGYVCIAIAIILLIINLIKDTPSHRRSTPAIKTIKVPAKHAGDLTLDEIIQRAAGKPVCTDDTTFIDMTYSRAGEGTIPVPKNAQLFLVEGTVSYVNIISLQPHVVEEFGDDIPAILKAIKEDYPLDIEAGRARPYFNMSTQLAKDTLTATPVTIDWLKENLQSCYDKEPTL